METPEVIQLPSGELLPEGAGNALSIPVVIIPAVYTEPVKLGIQRAYNLVVNSPESYKEMAEVVNTLKKTDSFLKDHVLALGRPLREAAANITKQGDDFRAPIAPAYAAGSQKMLTYKKEEDAKIAAAAEAQRQERVRQEQELQRIADEKAKKEREALAAEEAATKKLAEAKTEKAKEKAIADIQTAQANLAEAAAMPEPSSIPFIPQAPLPTATTAKGVKMTRSVTLHSTDVTKLPAAYLTVNEALLKRHILDGVLPGQSAGKVGPGSATGATFTISEHIGGTGR